MEIKLTSSALEELKAKIVNKKSEGGVRVYLAGMG
jgi:Fe-S cluster assembly iron-binding protein IscA